MVSGVLVMNAPEGYGSGCTRHDRLRGVMVSGVLVMTS
jgi:hypothetical protein